MVCINVYFAVIDHYTIYLNFNLIYGSSVGSIQFNTQYSALKLFLLNWRVFDLTINIIIRVNKFFNFYFILSSYRYVIILFVNYLTYSCGLTNESKGYFTSTSSLFYCCFSLKTKRKLVFI